jgi:predicted lipid carrier protein YhbT
MPTPKTASRRARRRPRRRMSEVVADTGAQVAALTPPRLRPLALRGPQRELVLGRIFKLMEHGLDPAKTGEMDAVIHWRIRSPDGRESRWQLMLTKGRARSSRLLDREPRLTLTLSDERFLELVSGVTDGPGLFMSGDLQVDGDLMLAARLQSLFRIPRPRRRRR